MLQDNNDEYEDDLGKTSLCCPFCCQRPPAGRSSIIGSPVGQETQATVHIQSSSRLSSHGTRIQDRCLPKRPRNTSFNVLPWRRTFSRPKSVLQSRFPPFSTFAHSSLRRRRLKSPSKSPLSSAVALRIPQPSLPAFLSRRSPLSSAIAPRSPQPSLPAFLNHRYHPYQTAGPAGGRYRPQRRPRV